MHRAPLIVGGIGLEVDTGNRRDRSISQGAAVPMRVRAAGQARGRLLHPGDMGGCSPVRDCHPLADPCLIVGRFWMRALIVVMCEGPQLLVWTVRAESPAASPAPGAGCALRPAEAVPVSRSAGTLVRVLLSAPTSQTARGAKSISPSLGTPRPVRSWVRGLVLGAKTAARL